MPLQHPALEIDAANESNAYVVRIRGELDLGGCPALERALVEGEQSQADRVLLDLEGLTFVDASGLNVLVRAADRSASNGNRLRMTRPHGQVADVVSFTAVGTRLPFADRAPDDHLERSPDQT